MKSFLIPPEKVESIKNSVIGKFCKGKCLGRGAYLTTNGIFMDCECVEEFRRQIKLLSANIPQKYWDFDLRNLTKEFISNNKEALKIIKNYVDKIKIMVDEGVGLYIQGAHGLAKTALSYYILKEAMKQDIICYAISMSRLTGLFYDINIEENKELIEWIKNDVKLLVIEEIEKDYNIDKSTTFLGSMVNDFFRSIYDTKKSLIVNSNFSKKVLKESRVHADNVVDRFEELVDVILVGNSYRKQYENLRKIIEL
uniref:Uncharacterized protein n=1 Tax=Dictyoglomus turgidum TaxID=513050 RepID=A0A7C3WWX0_9BACT